MENRRKIGLTKEEIHGVTAIKFAKRCKAMTYALIFLNIVLITLTFVLAFSSAYGVPFTITDGVFILVPFLMLIFGVCAFLNNIFVYVLSVYKILKDCIKSNEENLKGVAARKSLNEEGAVKYFNKLIKYGFIDVEFRK